MILEFKKRKRSILERIFIYPSFTLRFWLYAIILFLAIGIPSLIIIPYIDNSADKLSSINIALQTVTLVFGIVATYFALKQLTESRFSNLDELGRQDAKEKKYFRAINN